MIGDVDLPPPPNTRGRRMTAAGFAFMLLAVSVGVGSGKIGLLIGLMGVLAGANSIAVGVRMDHDPTTPIVPVVFAGLGASRAFLHRNLAIAGLAMASCAVTALAAGPGPVLCRSMLALFLIGMSMITFAVLRE